MSTRRTTALIFFFAACVLCLSAPPAAAQPLVGAFVNPNGVNTPTEVVAFEQSLGEQLGVDSNYSRFNWSGALNREQWDISGGRIPMKSWSPTVGKGGCVQLTDVTAGKYDSQLKTQAAAVKTLISPVWIRLFYEMPENQAEICANPTQSASIFIGAWQHIVTLFRNAGATNAVWVWAPEDVSYHKGVALNYYPGSNYVDIVGDDVYNKSQSPEAFSAQVCSIGPQLGKPFVITETGAPGLTAQLAWLANVGILCPGLTAFVYWDAIGHNEDYIISDPSAFAALRVVGK